MVEITTKIEDSIYTITVDGEVDASSSIHLDNALEASFSNQKNILLDLEKLEYISSAGLGVFISRLEEVKEKNINLVFYGMNENVRQVFNILGLESLLNIKGTKEEAIKALNEA